jgi:tripartite-type tricarboxylate transporter receptor subunit TctC
VIIENRPGASSTIGADFVAKSIPDGYTILMMPGTHVLGPFLLKSIPFDPINDFTPLAFFGTQPELLIANTQLPFSNLKDMFAWAKANPNKFTYGTPGTGSSPHLAIEEFAQRAGIELSHIPFKGSSPNLQAVMGGHTMAMSDSTGWGQLVDAGKLRLLATYGSKRTTRWPTVATLNELGYDTVSDSPYGVCGPKNMDPAIVKILHDAFKKTLTDPSVLSVFAQFDQPIIEMNTEQYTKYANETFVAERKTIERLGLLNKD